MLDYDKLDNKEGRRWHYKKDWQQRAEALGYKYISEAIIKEYEKHQSSVVAKKMGVSSIAIRVRLKQFGIPLRPRGGANYKAKPGDTTYDKDIIRLYSVEGYSAKITGQILGLSYWFVYCRLVVLGVPRRGNRGPQKRKA